MTDSGPEGYLDRKFEEESQDLGHGVRIRPFSVGTPPKPAGVFVMHRHDDGELCMGSVMFAIPETAKFQNAKWTVEQADPLTISPSVLRRDCSLHGFIREGRWIPA